MMKKKKTEQMRCKEKTNKFKHKVKKNWKKRLKN